MGNTNVDQSTDDELKAVAEASGDATDFVAALVKRADVKFEAELARVKRRPQALFAAKKYDQLFQVCQVEKYKNAEAEAFLGVCYEHGYGTEKDIRKAADAYRGAAEKGYPMAQFAYSECLFLGKGVERNISRAKFWCRKAASSWYRAAIAITFAYKEEFQHLSQADMNRILSYEGEDAKTLFQKGILVLLGRESEVNPITGLDLIEKAASLKYPYAVFFQAVEAFTLRPERYTSSSVTKPVSGVFHSLEEAFAHQRDRFDEDSFLDYYEILKRAANLGCPEALCVQAELVFPGVGKSEDDEWVEANPTKGIKLLKRASELGNPDAMTQLGIHYLFGDGVEADEQVATEYFKKATEYGADDPRAYLALGYMLESGMYYEDGQFAPKGSEQAVEWYRKAYQIALDYDGGEDAVSECIDELRRYSWAKSKLRLDEDNKKLDEDKKMIVQAAMASFTQVAKQFESHVSEMFGKYGKSETDSDDIDPEMAVVMGLINSVTAARKTLIDMLRGCVDDFQAEEAEEQFFSDWSARLIQMVGSLDDRFVEYEEDYLKTYFGSLWGDLDAYTQRALVSSIVIFKKTKKVDVDFSGVVICATTALENELGIRFFEGYKAYLKKQGIPVYNWPESLVYMKNGTKVESARFLMGNLPFILGGKQRKTKDNGQIFRYKKVLDPSEEKMLAAYLKTIFRSETYNIDTLRNGTRWDNSIVDRCEDIRELYRNNAAHPELISRAEAEKCCESIIGFRSFNSLEAMTELNTIKGLLMDIAQITKNPNRRI